MSRVCQITGKHRMVGHRVSHSNTKTKRTFEPNLLKKRFYLPEDKRWITLQISAAGLRTISKIGIQQALKNAIDKGYYTDKI